MSTLVAGFGNIFFSDDGLGCEVIRRLAESEPPSGVTLRDFGVGGLHLALEMLGEYDLVIIVDAVARGDSPGTVFAIDCTHDRVPPAREPDAHDMTIGGVLALYEHLREQTRAAHRPRIIVAGCVPQNLDEGMGLSEPVRAALPACIDLVRGLMHHPIRTGAGI